MSLKIQKSGIEADWTLKPQLATRKELRKHIVRYHFTEERVEMGGELWNTWTTFNQCLKMRFTKLEPRHSLVPRNSHGTASAFRKMHDGTGRCPCSSVAVASSAAISLNLLFTSWSFWSNGLHLWPFKPASAQKIKGWITSLTKENKGYHKS